MKKTRWWLLVTVCLVAAASPFAGGDPPEAFDKDQFRSRRKWYVSFVFSLKGRSEATRQERGDSWTTRWKILREITGTFVLEEVHSGANSRPEKSIPLQGENAGDRFVSWDVVEGVSEAEWRVDDFVEHESLTHGEIHAATTVKGFSQFTGTGTTEVGRHKELKCDLSEMVYDYDLSGLRNPKKRTPDNSQPLVLTGEYHSFTEGTGVRKDINFPITRWGVSSILPQLTETLRKQFLSRKLELSEGKIKFTVAEPVTRLPYIPSPPISIGGDRFGDGTTKGGEPLEMRVTVILSPTPPSRARLVLKPVGYDRWRPLCSSSEFVKGNDLPVEWKVEEEGGNPSRPLKVRRVDFRLQNVSALPGVCMNWPVHLTTETPDRDLRFDAAYPPPAGHEVRELGSRLTLTGAPAEAGKGTVRVECFDSGATGELVAVAILEDGRELNGEVEGPEKYKLLIPDHEPGVSYIARCWRNEMAAGKLDEVDDDNFPEGDGQHGDGLTVWEEYRGFWVGGSLDTFCAPQTKDLFICNRIGGAARNGIDVFREATKLIVHDKLRPGEFKDDRIINFHHTGRPHLVNQHGINVEEGGYFSQGEDGAVSSASICNGMVESVFPGPPKNTFNVSILPSMLSNVEPAWQYSNGEAFRAVYADVTIAHELGHGLGIRHHGAGDGVVTFKFEKLETGELVTTVNGTRVVLRNEKTSESMTLLNFVVRDDPATSKTVPFLVGALHGQMSGDVMCFMRYDTANCYRSKDTPNEFYCYWEPEVWGDRLCALADGTGCNSPTHLPQSRYGDAAAGRGNCFHRFVVSDRWESKNK